MQGQTNGVRWPHPWVSNLNLVSEQERTLILTARKAIQRARFQNLSRQINQLQRSTKEVRLTPVALLAKLVEILRTYPLAEQSTPPVAAAQRWTG